MKRRKSTCIDNCSQDYLDGKIDFKRFKEIASFDDTLDLHEFKGACESDGDLNDLDADNIGDISIDVFNCIISKSSASTQKPRRNFGFKSKEIRDQRRMCRRQKMYLPYDVSAIIGLSNIAYAQSKLSKALGLCKEALKRAPRAAEPWILIARILDDIGRDDLAIQVRILVANLTNNKEDWLHLYESALDNNKITFATTCIAKAISCDPHDVTLHLTRLDLTRTHQLDGKRTDALGKLLTVLKECPSAENFLLHMYTVREIVARLERNGDMKQAEEILRTTYELYDDQVEENEIKKLIRIQLYLQFYFDVMNKLEIEKFLISLKTWNPIEKLR